MPHSSSSSVISESDMGPGGRPEGLRELVGPEGGNFDAGPLDCYESKRLRSLVIVNLVIVVIIVVIVVIVILESVFL